MTSAGKSGRWRQRHRDDVDLRTPVAARLDCNLSRWRVVAKCLLALRLHIVLASPRADGRRAHGRSALSDLAHCTQPAVHPRLQCPFAALLLRVRRPRNGSVSTVSAQNVSDHPADLDGDRRDRLSGGCADKTLAAGDPPATIIGGPSSRTRTGSQPPLRKLWDTRSATAEIRRPTS